jgi:hypothetical protein
LFPALKSITGGVDTSQKVLHLLCFAFFLISIIFFKIKKYNKKVVFSVSAYGVFVSIYYSLCTILFTNTFQWADFVDLARPPLYLIYFLFPLIVPLREGELKTVVNFLFYACLIQILFSCFVYFSSLWPLVDLYKGRLSNDPIIMHFYRWSGTFGYPSDFSFFLSLFIYLKLLEFVDKRSKNDYKLNLYLTILVIGLFFTFSRGGIGTVVIVIFVLILFQNIKFKIKTLFPICCSLIIVFGLYGFYNSETVNYVGTDYIMSVISTDGDVDDSTHHRIYELKLAYEYAIKYFPFGSGSNRTELKSRINVIESFYGYHLMKWGVFGLLLILIPFAYMSKVSFCVGKYFCHDSLLRNFSLAVLLLTVSVPLSFGWSSAISDRFKGLPFFYLMNGYIFMLYVEAKIRAKIVFKKGSEFS